jgi:hypothetical protein
MKTFKDPITLENTPINHGIRLNGQFYAASSLLNMMNHKNFRVPMTRRLITLEEVAEIKKKAGKASGNNAPDTAQLTKEDVARMKKAGDSAGTMIINPFVPKNDTVVAITEGNMIVGYSPKKWAHVLKTNNFFNRPDADFVTSLEYDAKGRVFASARGARVPLMHFPKTLVKC